MLPWTRAPFGYRVDPDRPRDPAGVRIEEAEAAIVREMFAWYAEEAHSFCSLARLLEQRGFPTGDAEQRRESLLLIARAQPTEHADLWDLAEGLLEHDSLASQWRSRHVDMVERQIGTKSGTGGSSGAPYLRTRLAVRYYPELWDLRSYL